SAGGGVRRAGQRDAGVAHDRLTAAGGIRAVRRALGGGAASLAASDHGGAVAEVDRAAPVEDVQRSLPESLVAELLAVADDASVELVDLVEAARAHQPRQHLAPDTAGAV